MSKLSRCTILKIIGSLSLGSMIPFYGKASVAEDEVIRNRKIFKTDILIVGGGTAGIIAALQAARAGCSTILVEIGSQLGGTTTTGGVAFPGLFHAWGKQIIGGIGWELVPDTVKMSDGVLPDFSIPTGKQHWKHQIPVNPYIYSLLAEEKCLDAGVQIRYYETPVSANFIRNKWEVETVGKGTNAKIVCDQLIDCTGNAYITSLAGFKVKKEEETQPGTLMFKIEGYDFDKLDLKLLQQKYNDAVSEGKLKKEEFRSIYSLLRTQGTNLQHIAGADSTTAETHTLANINGRLSLTKHLKFLRTLPGCEEIKLTSMQPETGVRETYRIDGEYQITLEDYISGRVFEDAVCYSFYPIDLHDKNGVDPKPLKEGTVATVPLRALVPKGSENLLVAGRSVSSDRLANSALRMQASCMAMGQAAAATAVLANRHNTNPINIPVNNIKSMVLEHGGIVP